MALPRQIHLYDDQEGHVWVENYQILAQNMVVPKDTGPGPLHSFLHSVLRRTSHANHPGATSVHTGDLSQSREVRPGEGACISLGKRHGVIWAWNSGILGACVMVWKGKVLVLGTFFIGLMDALCHGKGHILNLDQNGVFLDGNSTWDFSKSWLLSLGTIKIIKNNWDRCQTSCFAIQAGLLEPIVIWKINSLKYVTTPKHLCILF